MVLSRFTTKKAAPVAPVAVPRLDLPMAPRPAAPQLASVDAQYLRTQQDKLLDAKLRIHRKIVEEINLAAVDKATEKELRAPVKQLVAQFVVEEKIALNSAELERFVDDILHEMTGLGPIEPLLADDSINDILINTHNQIYIERRGKLELSNARFKDEPHLIRIINKIVSTVGRRVDESQPMCDARLPDGSRVNVAIKPIAVDGPLVSIRKFSKKPL
jgi:pilus assembly protein CpaF